MCTCSSSFLSRCSTLACVSGGADFFAAEERAAPSNSRATSSTRRSCSRFPAAVITTRFGAYHSLKHSDTASCENSDTVSGLPRIGLPSGCPRQKLRVNSSWIRYSGLSSSILSSSRTTCFSFAMSSASNRGCSTRSERTSTATGMCSSSTFALKQVISLAVNASSIPPTESTDCAISSAVRLLVPLNTMCSMKCARPFRSMDSARDPVPSQIPTEADRTCGIFSVTITTPLGSSARWISLAG